MTIKKEDFQNFFLVRLIDANTNYPIRAFYTTKPEMYLKTYTFMKTNDIDVAICSNEEDANNKYNDHIGSITEIEVQFGDHYSFNIIDIYIEVRNYK